MTTTRKDRGPKWSWRDGVVDQQGDHLELRYGHQDAEPETWVAVARVGPPRGRVFPVQWLLDRNAPANRDTVDATVRDLAFILTEVGGSDPWLYGQYHAGTTSNCYGSVHWVNCVRTRPVTKSRSEAARKAWRTRRAQAPGAQVERGTLAVEKGETGERPNRSGRWTAIEEAMRTGRVVSVKAPDGRSLDRERGLTIFVEVHPWTRLGLPKRWRVMCNGEQRSVHETKAKAEAAARSLRGRAAGGTTAPPLAASRSSKSRQGRRR